MRLPDPTRRSWSSIPVLPGICRPLSCTTCCEDIEPENRGTSSDLPRTHRVGRSIVPSGTEDRRSKSRYGFITAILTRMMIEISLGAPIHDPEVRLTLKCVGLDYLRGTRASKRASR